MYYDDIYKDLKAISKKITFYLLLIFLLIIILSVYVAYRDLKQSRKQYYAERRIRLLSSAIETTSEAIVLCDFDGIVKYVNPSACELEGASSEDELIGTSMFHYTDKKGIAILKNEIMPSIKEGKQWSGEFIAKKVDGTRYPAEITCNSVYDDTGKLEFVITVWRDISGRKETEEALKGSEELFRTVVDSSIDAMIAIDHTGQITIFNPAAEKMFGYNKSQMIGEGLEILLPEGIKKVHHQYVSSYFSNGKPDGAINRIVELKAVRSSGDEFPIELSLSHGKRRGDPFILAVIRDITVRKKTLEQLKKLSRAVEHSPTSVVITDNKGIIEYVNPAFCTVTGYKQEEVIGKNPSILKSGSTSDDIYKKMWETILAGQTWRGELCNRKKNNELYWEITSIAPVTNDEGIITHFVAFKEDVTEARDLQEQFQQAQKMEAIGRLAGGIAHDFNNVLTAITGNTELALMSLAEEDPLKRNLKDIGDAAQRAAGLTRQLLAFSRKQVIQPRILNINKTLSEMDRMLQRIIGEDILLQMELSEEISTIKADPSQIEQIIINLAVNARDAMKKGGRLTVETSIAELSLEYTNRYSDVDPGNYVMVAVTDNGEGINEELKAKIFEPFFTTKGEGEGTGLGLATVYGIVKQNKGHITVYSELGFGTTFKVYFPSIGKQVSIDLNKKTVTRDSMGNETVLLVEDEDAVRNLATRTLQKFGYNVIEAKSGGDAWFMIKEMSKSVDMLVTDVVMPNMSGPDLVDKIRTIIPELKVLFMSGYTEKTIIDHGMLKPGTQFISKPFHPHELAEKVRTILDMKIMS